MRLLCLGGSLRAGSLTTKVLHMVAQGAERAGCDVDVFTVADLPEFFIPGVTRASDPAVARLGGLVEAATCLFIMTPIYGGTPSGAVKNLLDTLHLFKDGSVGPLSGRRVASGSVGGGGLAGHYEPQPTANYALEIACTNLGAWVSPRHIELSELAFDETGAIVEPYAADAVHGTVRELLLMDRRVTR